MEPDESRVLVVAGFGAWVDGVPKTGKIVTHLHPLARAAREVHYVCSGPTAEGPENLSYLTVERSRWKPLTLARQFLTLLRVARSGEYDLIASFTLLPYGVFALAAGRLSRTPVHLGVIGGDLDVHAMAWYGVVIRWCFRRFDAVSVAGESYRRRLVQCGVAPASVFTVIHPVNRSFADRSRLHDPAYDVLWLTRLSPEKAPLRFVDAIAELRDRGLDVTAALVGDGPQAADVRAAVRREGLSDRMDLPGWAEDPLEYYQDARVYVLTSDREMLPLTLVEAMAVGLPSVAPSIGAIPDVIDHRENGLLVEAQTPTAYADAIQALLTDEALYSKLGENAPAVESRLSERAAVEDWRTILRAVAVPPS